MILIIGGNNQGKLEYAKARFSDYEIFDNLHEYIKSELKNSKNENEITKEILIYAQKVKQVIICDEIGNGIVPIIDEDRKWREITGRILIDLAARAEEVHRVVCGIGKRIK
ncbi:MAG: bifunctional adenosylcobinamide kinase/adenosylcobinamide-phosphate guanylyltransferase [Butyrivibrio sp.]|nr:bifunctional adenosylcobinamide kinase/adenosylcobinamide-phosphate guanylyltransferase [Butyrivibrio sp.]